MMKPIKNKAVALILSMAALLVLSACSSEGTSSNHGLVEGGASYLIVDAGQDKDVAAGHNVSLHGVVGTDGANIPLKIVWTQLSGNPGVVINDVDTLNPTFTSLNVQTETLLTFNLHVTSGGFDVNDSVTISVIPTALPQVLPAHVITTHPGSTVTVHSNTLAPTPNHTHTHQWTQVSGPTVALQHPTQTHTTFVAPTATGAVPIVLQHVVTSTPTNSGAATTTTTLHTIQIAPHSAVGAPLSVVVSNAADVFETLGSTLHVSATGGDGGPYTYTWSQNSGTAVGLNQSDLQNPVVITPPVTKDEVIELQVVVDDGSGHSVAKHIPMTIKNVKLSIIASSGVLAQGSHTTYLHVAPIATASIPVLNPLHYHWSEVSTSNAPILHADTDNPQITLPAGSGTYTFKVEVTDSAGNSASDTVNVTATDDLYVNAGKNFIAVENSPVSLHALTTGAFGAAKISWKQLPGAPAVTLQGADTMNPTFTAPFLKTTAAEIFTFELSITDDKGRTASDRVEVTITPLLPKVSISGTTSIPVSSVSGAHCSAAGGDAPYTYAWSIAPGADASWALDGGPDRVSIHAISSANSPVILTCEVTDKHGRKVNATHKISIYNAPPVPDLTVTASISQTITENQIGVLSAHAQGGTGPYTFMWHPDPTLGTIGDETRQNTFLTPSLVNNSQGLTGVVGQLSVTVTDANGDTADSAIQYMIVKDAPLTVTVTGATIVGKGHVVHLTATARGGDGNYTYEWYDIDPDNPFSRDPNLIIPSKQTQIPATINFTLKVKNTINGITETVTKPVSVEIKP